MKISEKLILNLLISSILEEVNEDRFGQAIADFKKAQSGTSSVESLLPTILDVLKEVRKEISDNAKQKRLDQIITKLKTTMARMGVNFPTRPFDFST